MLFCARVTGLLLHGFLKIRHTLLRAETDRGKEGIKCLVRHHRGHAGISFFLASTPITMSSELILTFDF